MGQVKVVNKTLTVSKKFSLLKIGTFFTDGNRLFIKTSATTSGTNSLEMDTGNSFLFHSDSAVVERDVEITVVK